MSEFEMKMIIDKLSQCMGVEKATTTLNSFCLELGYGFREKINAEELVQLCERMEQEGGFMKMMGSVLKIQAML